MEAPPEMAGTKTECPQCERVVSVPLTTSKATTTHTTFSEHDSIFDCPFCKKSLAIDEQATGRQIKCPDCSQNIEVPPKPDAVQQAVPSEQATTPVPKTTTPPPAETKTRSCPFCGETILIVAIKCKHCHADLTGKTRELAGIVALVLPIFATILAWSWLCNMPLLFGPSFKLYGLFAVTVLATAGLIATEANTVGAGLFLDVNKEGEVRRGPVFWFLICAFVWFAGFPMWMRRRVNEGLPNRWTAKRLC
jgi:DNA-directed RNA polymerase subunit RPC12/RpoP